MGYNMMRCISISGAGIFINALKKFCFPVFFAIKRQILRHFEAVLIFLSEIEIRENQKNRALTFCINQPPAILKIRKRMITQTPVIANDLLTILFHNDEYAIYF